jgi:hypothetical protein
MSKARELANLGNAYSDGALSNRNLIINGAMQVAQRGTSETGVTAGGYSTVDRFMFVGNIGTRTNTQETDAPSGFSNSSKVEVTTAEAPPSVGDYLTIEHKVEGQNLQMLKKGTADALPVTVSFWVKSNVTGTYILEIDDNDNARNINKSYTVDASATWEYKTITFEGDTTGAFDNDASYSARLIWWLDAGSTFRGGTLATSWEPTNNSNRVVGNVALGDTVGNYFQITGVQLEVGDTATPFEHRSYGDELARCQRYYYNNFNGNTPSTVRAGNGPDNRVSIATRFNNGELQCAPISFPTTMRASGSVIYYSPSFISTLNNWGAYGPTNGWSAGLTVSGQNVTKDHVVVFMNGAAGVSDFQSFIVSGYLEVDAEL